MGRSSPPFSVRRMPTEEAHPSTAADVKPGRRMEMASPPTQFQSSSGLIIQEFKNFKRSAAPSRFLFFRDCSWSDFPPMAFDALRSEFVAGRTAFELPIAGCSYVFDFLRMSQVDVETGAANSIAWIDVNGGCFFPALAVDEQRNSRRPGQEMDVKVEVGKAPAVLFEGNSSGFRQEQSGDSYESSTVDAADQPRWHGVETLTDGDKYFKVVEKLFLSGMRRFLADTVVTAIRRCSHSGPLGASRLRAFQMKAHMTKAVRDNDNVKFGWYGASATELAAILAHGFGQLNNKRLASDARGVGVHLSAPDSPFSSSLLAEADANEERHMVLCRVIMGRPEKVEAGSTQYHPSSEEFDSGVDDIENPIWYVVWSTHMNTHILPEYIVSYKSSNQPRGAPKPVNPRRNPVSSNLLFPELLAEMGRFLPSSMTRAVQIIYKQYKGRKIGKETFIRYIRSIVGDKVLISAIKRIRGY